ncbi:MAG: hypothetical protein ABW185_24145 [Sedimenticola sp.]
MAGNERKCMVVMPDNQVTRCRGELVREEDATELIVNKFVPKISALFLLKSASGLFGITGNNMGRLYSLVMNEVLAFMRIHSRLNCSRLKGQSSV